MASPLEKKIGYKDESKVILINSPEYYFELFTSLPEIQLIKRGKADVIHYFVDSQKEFLKTLPKLKGRIKQNGMIWTSWPKKASKVASDMSEDVIRDYAISIGLVDVKVCSVNEIWSGLKLVIPLKLRIKEGK